MTNVLITGTKSYIGNIFADYLTLWPEKYHVSHLSLRGDSWKSESFRGFDTLFHVAGLAHDSTRHSDKDAYYRVNSQLTFDVANKAKSDGIRQFIFMSSSIVYGTSAPIGQTKIITPDTEPSPASYYGDSKLKAEEMLKTLHDDSGFRVCVIRSPMVYGKGSKGNYPLLSKLARTLPFFPNVRNTRSMIYVYNLAEFVRLLIDYHEKGTFWPQNKEYSDTSELVKLIAEAHGRNIKLIGGFDGLLKLLGKFTGKVDKAFGSLAYDLSMSEYRYNYRLFSLAESITDTEC